MCCGPHRFNAKLFLIEDGQLSQYRKRLASIPRPRNRGFKSSGTFIHFSVIAMTTNSVASAHSEPFDDFTFARKKPHVMGAEIPRVPDALRLFDELPNSAYVRTNVVIALFGFSLPTLYRRMAEGKFPRPIRVNGSRRLSAWQVGTLRKLLAEDQAQAELDSK